MPDSLERIITNSGNVFGIAADTTALVGEAISRHDLGPTAAAALGRALTGAVLLAGLQKDRQSVQLIFEGNGPLGKVMAEASATGTCRGYVANPRVDIPLRNGQIDVAAGIGGAGFLRVIKDIGMKEKYTGLVQLFTSEIGDDIAYYLTESEQTPSTVGVGVHLLPDGSVAAAGGFLIQTLPPADDALIAELEKAITSQDSIVTMLGNGLTPAQILSRIFSTVPHHATTSTELSFSCSCSTRKMEEVLRGLPAEDLHYLLEKDNGIEMACDFCSNRYFFDATFIKDLLEKQQ